MKITLFFLLLFTTGLFAQNEIELEFEYSDWSTFEDPHKALQVRYKLEKQEGDTAYFKTQFRINYEEPTICTDLRCLGYAFSFAVPQLNDKDFLYFYAEMYYTYKNIYTLPNLFLMKLSFPDGSKRLLKKDGFYYSFSDTKEPVRLENFFIKGAAIIYEDAPLNFKNYVESEAIILK